MMYRYIALFLVLLVSPIIVLIFVIALLLDGWPVFFFQERMGQFGKPFWIIKFRTMLVDAQSKQGSLRKKNEADGPVFKMRNDPRFTHLGKLLSHTGLDELLQLFNIIKGEMTFIGPRPLPIEEARQLKPWMREREQVLPGLISPAIVSGNYHEDFDAWMKSDVYYAQHKSVGTDLALLLPIVLFLVTLVFDEIKLALKKITT